MIKANEHINKTFYDAYEQYWKMLVDIALAKTGETNAAKDLVQEVFIGFWNNISSIGEEEIKFYLLKSIRNRLFNYYRNTGVKQKHQELYLQTLVQAEEQTFHTLNVKELEQIIRREISLLPEKMGEIVRMSCMENFSHSEIADQLSLSTQTVKNQLSTGRKRLKQALSEYPLDYHLAILLYFLDL
ncbi:RNA polymerase sigma factor [Desertivirga brevis]|uniref:RNA polymerase sigma factor n=1 Tax=Desertivirga brevis TaxID=2810310 RepID=UPI001A965607|nr:sigma-70 family RNA polymerase sigma factor [Pedobacter sp. SYSU D00873]